jgi:protein-tyrosine phosphatase
MSRCLDMSDAHASPASAAADESRAIVWDGFFNARDLGGLPTTAGALTRHGSLIRSADLRLVTDAGWREAYEAGVRTILDLRNDDEVYRHDSPGLTALGGSAQFAASEGGPVEPPGMRRVHVPLDGVDDVAFWRYLNEERLNGTPLYYLPFLEHRPDRVAAAVAAVAHAGPGALIFHCGGGRDRTGLLALLLLALAGVDPEAIAMDYELSTQRRRALLEALGYDDDSADCEQALADRGTTARAAILATLDGLDAPAYLFEAGLRAEEVDTVRKRLVSVPD